jgi:uncharacterized cupredoxin-like copper-binding protein
MRAGFVTVTLLVLAACGSGTAGASLGSSPIGTTAGAIEVHVADFKITPAQIDARGPSVTLNVTNDGPTVHNVSVRDGSGNVVLRTKDLKPGESETVSGQLPAGNLTTFCSLPGHESLGTRGALVVTQP